MGIGFISARQFLNEKLGFHKAVEGLSAVPFTAAGTGQATATLLTKKVVVVRGANGTNGVRLTATPTVGDIHVVYNQSKSNGLKVYPGSGGAINEGTTNAAITLAPRSLAILHAISSSSWGAIYTAAT